VLSDPLLESWNEEPSEDLQLPIKGSMVVFSRDWTVETIESQIKQDNIKLNPKFQRRHAWEDIRRSRLIESLIIGVPVPEIILAEDKKREKSFIVIDGKQRLSTIAGFFNTDLSIWDNPALQGLTARPDLAGKSFQDISTDPNLKDDYRKLINADIRCTVISNYSDEKILFDIFYRLNTGSVPLSSQELRQVLYPGPFAEFLFDVTNKIQPIHEILDLDQPDARLRDIELILRLISFLIFDDVYSGNLDAFLNYSMDTVSSNWKEYEDKAQSAYASINQSINKLVTIFEIPTKIGRKPTLTGKRSVFNKSLFEALVISFIRVPDSVLTISNNNTFLEQLAQISVNNINFRTSIESTTKSLENYRHRFEILQGIINSTYSTDINYIPVKPIV
jgi:hypothetical protein